jgi:hypothetical protein
VNNENVERETSAAPNPTGEQTSLSAEGHVSVWGLHEASAVLYDACLRAAETFKLIADHPEVIGAMDERLKLQFTIAKLYSQQALDQARRLS